VGGVAGPELTLHYERPGLAGHRGPGDARALPDRECEQLMQRLLDRVAVITGAGSGIGLACVRRLAAEGAKIVAVDIDGETGKAAAT